MKRLLLLGLLFGFVNTIEAQGYLETQKVTASQLGTAYNFGHAVAIQGDIAVIGSSNANFQGNGPLGVTYIFKKNGNGNWEELQVLVAPDRAQFDKFGQAVAISNDYIVVSASGQRADVSGGNIIAQAGAVYIYKNNGDDTWVLEQKITASDREFGAWFGFDVAIEGNRIVVGCGRNSYDVNGENFQHRAGAAYIFEKDVTNVWNQVAKVVAPDRATEDRFGYAVSINGDYASVGAYNEDEDENGNNTISSAGAVYVYKRENNGNWSFQQKLVPTTRPDNSEWLGWSLDMDSEYIVAGAIAADEPSASSGAVYIFKRDVNDTWNEVDKLTATDGIQGEWFGYDVAIQDDRILVGAYQDYITTNGIPNTHGSVYLYLKDTNSDSWSHQQKVIASNWQDANIHNFGISVAVSNDDLIIGNSISDEIDTNTSNPINEAGSAYMLSFDPDLVVLSNNPIDNTLKFKAYPNPVVNTLHIDFKSSLESVNISIHNSLGQEVYSNLHKNTISIRVPFNFSKGVYWVKVGTAPSKISTLKVLKQ